MKRTTKTRTHQMFGIFPYCGKVPIAVGLTREEAWRNHYFVDSGGMPYAEWKSSSLHGGTKCRHVGIIPGDVVETIPEMSVTEVAVGMMG